MSLAGLRVLLVHDAVGGHASDMARRLADHGAAARAATRASLAQRGWEVGDIDLVLWDRRLPEQTRDQLERRLNRDSRGPGLLELDLDSPMRDIVARLHARHDERAVPGMVAQSAEMAAVLQRIRMFARHRATVLVIGETGTGKDLVARAIHDFHSPNASFVAVTCGAIPPGLAESELFGHERGAFTGAIRRHLGAFERANGGTLLFDDIDDLPPDVQAKLLRVLQEGRITRVGGRREIPVDVRVIATSKTDPARLVSEDRFRPDLFYRLRGLEIRLPALRERRSDILPLARHFLDLEHGTAAPVIGPVARARLINHEWPGNVRELRQTMLSAAVLAEDGVIQMRDLPDHLQYHRQVEMDTDVVSLHVNGRESVDLTAVVGDVERNLLQWALDKASGSQSRAAELLCLPRTTFQSKLRRYDID